MAFDLQRLKQLIDRHGQVAHIVITDVRGSTPRTVGTEMFVWDNGQDNNRRRRVGISGDECR